MNNEETLTIKIVKVKCGTLAFHIILFNDEVEQEDLQDDEDADEKWVAPMRMSSEQTAIGWYFEINSHLE